MNREPPSIDPQQYLRTETVQADLGAHSLRAAFIRIAARPLQVALELGSIMILARLLTPEDFGLRAMVFPVTVLVFAVANLGLQPAVIQRENLDHRQLSALFWVALVINAVLLVLMALLAPVLAWFYHDPRVTAITLAWAVSVYVRSLSAFQEALLMRQMRFGAVTSIYLGSLVVGIVVAVAAALRGAGYWALILQVVTSDLISSMAIWLACRWRPSRPELRFASADLGTRAMLSYGANLTGSRVVSWLGHQLDRLLVGYVAGAGVLGLYHNARRWALFPFDQLRMSLSGVVVSALSRARERPQKYRAYCRVGLLPVLSVGMPAVAFVFIEAHDVVLVVLGDQWLEAVPFLRLMCLASFFGSVNMLTKWLYLVEGQMQRQLRWELVHTSVMVAAVVVGAMWGAAGVAVGFALSKFLLAYPTVAYCLRTSLLRFGDFLQIVWRPALASWAAALLAFFGGSVLLTLDELLTGLLVKLLGFGTLYVLIWAGLPGGREAVREIVDVLAQQRVRSLRAAAAPYSSAASDG